MTTRKSTLKDVSTLLALQRTPSYHDLFDAIGDGNADKVQTILQTTKDPIGLMKKKDLQGLTPLRKAMALNKTDIARILVVAGADASQRGALNKQALHDAALVGQRELIAPLLTSANISVNVKDDFGMTPLHNAVRGKHVKAVEWLLFAGANVDTPNDHDDTPLSLCKPDSDNENEKLIYQLLSDNGTPLDSLDLSVCCGYVGQKQISNVGSDGSLMFVTSELWPNTPQFIFCVKVNPAFANPGIPLKSDERFYDLVYRYRMMYALPKDKRRVKLYFTILEEFVFSSLTLKVCSKSKYIGEVPVTISSYPYHKYINFLASCEMDLQNEGQFVLTKRTSRVMLQPDVDGVLSYSMVPLFKLAAAENTFPPPPANWNDTRKQRATEEYEKLVESLPKPDQPDSEDNANNSNLKSKQGIEVVPPEDEGNGENDDEEVEAQAILLDWSEPDDCEDFYYVSPGWGCYFEYRRAANIDTVVLKHASDVEEPIVRCITNFFRLAHPSNKMRTECLCQISKSPLFQKIGTVLVFQRQELGPDEKEDPYPDEQKDEQYLSDDGRRSNGKVWLHREMKRWSLIQSGFVSKPTRIIFKTNILCTYVAVQLTIGEEKWEPELDDSSDEDDDSDDDFDEEGGEEGGAKEEGEGGEDAEEGEERKKKKKKKKKAKADEDAGGEGQEGDENASNVARNNKFPDNKNTNNDSGEIAPTDTVFRGIEAIDSEFAVGLDEVEQSMEPEESGSVEELGDVRPTKTLSVLIKKSAGEQSEQFTFGPPRTEEEFEEEQYNTILTEVALIWRYRNHREAKVIVFSRHKRDFFFDLVVELIQDSDSVVRAEARWTEGFKMVACSPPFLTLTGRLFYFDFEGAMIIKSPDNGASRPVLFYSIQVNELWYVVKRVHPEEVPAPGKKMKKKEDPAAESNEIDTVLEVTAFPRDSKIEVMDIASIPIPLTGPSLWREHHLSLRIPDKELLEPLTDTLKKEPTFTDNWWRIWVLLGFEEKQVDVEKVKQDWPVICDMMLANWFQQNIDANDRGISNIIYILSSLGLDMAVFKILGELKRYKQILLDAEKAPRQLDLLYHWIINTKMTYRAFQRKIKEPPINKYLSNEYLLHLNELVDPNLLFEIGAKMELDDNMVNSINGEENISDPQYKTFKVLVKSHQKKEEIIGFTLLLIEMLTALKQTKALEFAVREMRRWMASVIDTNVDICTKLGNVLQQFHL